MSLYSLSIRRPVLSTVFALLIMIFGAVGFYFLGVREYPAVDPPVISVATSYRGANADVIDSQITEPLEEQVNGIDGIRTIESVSRQGQSTITVEFNLGANLERAANDVRERVSRAQQQLPPDAEPPSVSKSDASAPPIVFLNIKSDTRSLMELTEIADKRFKERLQTIDGVSRVDIWGEKTYSMRLQLDPQRLAAYNLTPIDVRTALDRANVELPSGRIEGETIELTVRTKSRLETVEDFRSLILKQSEDGQTVRLSDVGSAEIAPLNQRTLLQRDGIPMVGVVLRPLPGANYIDIVDEFYNRLDRIRADLPGDLELGIGFDNTEPIRDSINEVQQTIFIAFLLVVLIIFLFLRDWRSTLIPLVVVPIALIGAFFVMYAMGFSINVLTLLALVLAIGLVVDDAIVVLENIYAKLEEGKDPVTAGLEGTREIFFAVVATSISLVIIFAPIVFMGGLTGQLFKEFGVVIAGAVAFSSFVALTLTPMLSTRILKQRDQKPWIYRKTEPFFQALTDAYRDSLQAFMAHRWTGFLIMAACVALIATFHFTLPQKLAPLEDRSLVRISTTAREGATYEYMSRYVDKMYQALNETIPKKHQRATISVTSPGFGAASSVNSAFMFSRMIPPSERDVSQMAYADSLQAAFQELEGARTYVSQEPTISVGGGGGGLPVQYVLQTSSVDNLRETLPTFLQEARAQEELAFVDVNLKFNKPELQVEIDRNKADNIGVSPLDVAQTLQLALAEQRVGFFVRDGEQRQIIASVDEENRDEPVDLTSLYVRSSSGEPVPLDNLVSVREQATPPQLFRFNRYMAATVSARPAPGNTIEDGINAMDRVAEEVLGPSFTTTLTGQSRDFQETSNQLLYVFGLALLLIYLVLAAQFESFRDPLIILFTVPLALAGAMLFLWYFNQSLNIFSQIGMVMLIGLVAKNGILIVEFANQRKAAGLSIREAIEDAAAVRFRPILMTALSTVLGVLPIALALGAGAESRMPMGIAVIGGLLVGTFLSLYVIPATYTFLTSEDAGPVLAGGDGVATGDGLPEEDGDAGQRGTPGTWGRRVMRGSSRRGGGRGRKACGLRITTHPLPLYSFALYMTPPLRLVLGCLFVLGPALFSSSVQAQASFPRDTLRLDAAVQRAIDGNLQARIARREVDIAENNVSVGNAGFLPTLTGQAGYSETISNSEDVFLDTTQTTTGARSNQQNAGADLRWTVFDGLRPFATYDRLGAERDRQAAATEEQIEALTADVIDTYYDVARRQQQLAVLREALSISRERLRIVEVQREVGSASDLDVRQAQVDLNADSAAVLRQETELATAKSRLNRLLGRSEEASTRYAVTSTIDVDTTLGYRSLQGTAFQESPALSQVRDALRTAQAERREIRADFFPTVDLTAGVGYSRSESESGFFRESTSTDFSYGVSLTFDLFDGLNRWRRTQNAEIRATNARLAVEDVRSRLRTELTSAYERYRNRLRLVKLERENLAAVRANVDVALEQFELGTITSVELREVQEQFIEAESRLLTAQFEAKRAEVELLRLSGQLLDRMGE